MLIAEARPEIPGVAGAGIVEREEHAPWLVVCDLDGHVDLVFGRSGAQQHVGLLDRMLRGNLQVARYFPRIGRLPFLDRGEAIADVIVVETRVAFNYHTPHL